MIAHQPEIRAKIVAPNSPGPTLRRERLLNMLRQGLLRKLTVVHAPAGYGKTTILSEFSRSIEFPVAWYTLGPHDTDIPTLLRVLVHSVQNAGLNIGAQVLRRLGSDPAFGQDAEEAAEALFAEFQNVRDYVIVVLDDFHNIEGCHAACAFFEIILERSPENAHFMISGRSWPPIRSLARMLANGVATVLTAEDLAFSSAETRELLAFYPEVHVQSEDSERIVSLTGGWPAAIVLLMNQMRNVPPGSYLWEEAPWDAQLARYLKVEIFEKLPQDEREFVLFTSILDDVSPDVCDELLGRNDSGDILDRLIQSNLPIKRLEGDPLIYRYHALLQEFLRQKLRDRRRETWIEFQEKAATIFARRENWAESIYHWSQIKRWDSVAAIISDIGQDMQLGGQWQNLASWIDQLPRKFLFQRSSLALLRARIAYLLQDADLALRLIAVLRPSLGPTDVDLLAECLAIRGATLSLKGEYGQAIRSCHEALEVLKTGPAKEQIEADVFKYLGIAHGMKGDYVQAIEYVSAAVPKYAALGNSYEEAICHIQLGVAYFHLNKLNEAGYHFERARDSLTRLKSDHLLVRVLNNLGVTYHWRGEFRQAEETLRQTIVLAHRIGLTLDEGYSLVSLADVERDLSNYSKSEGLYKKGLRIAEAQADGLLTLSAQIGLADVYRYKGDFQHSEGLAGQALLEAQRHSNPREIAFCLSMLGTISKDRGDPEGSLSKLSEAAELFFNAGAKLDATRALFHVASALYTLRRRAQAMKVLERVAELVKEIGFDHFLMADAARDLTLVEYAAAKKAGDGLFERIHLSLVHLRDLGHNRQTGAKTLPMVSIRSLGQFDASLNGVRIHDMRWQTAKAKEMLLYMLLHRHPIHKDEIISALWPDLEPAKINSIFHGTLHRLRKGTYDTIILNRGGKYELNPSGKFWFDVQELHQKISSLQTRGASTPDTQAARDAIKLYQGPLAPEFYSEWLQPIRLQLEDLYLEALRWLMSEAVRHKALGEAASLCDQIVQINPYDIDAWRVWIQVHIQQRSTGSALRIYRRCQDMFRGELGVDPPSEIVALASQLIV